LNASLALLAVETSHTTKQIQNNPNSPRRKKEKTNINKKNRKPSGHSKSEKTFYIDRKVDIPVGDKAVGFVSAHFPVRKVNLCRTLDYYVEQTSGFASSSSTHANSEISTCLLFHNTEENGLGIPLPGGAVSISRRRENNQLGHHPVSESTISAADPGDEVVIRVASLPVNGHSTKTVNYDAKKKILRETIELTLRNTGTESVSLNVEEFLISHTTEHIDVTNSVPAHVLKKEEPYKLRWNVVVHPSHPSKISYTVVYSNYTKD